MNFNHAKIAFPFNPLSAAPEDEARWEQLFAKEAYRHPATGWIAMHQDRADDPESRREASLDDGTILPLPIFASYDDHGKGVGSPIAWVITAYWSENFLNDIRQPPPGEESLFAGITILEPQS
jgi:hypothetical protein